VNSVGPSGADFDPATLARGNRDLRAQDGVMAVVRQQLHDEAENPQGTLPDISRGATPTRRPDRVQKRDDIRPVKPVVPIGCLYEQRADSPCLVVFVVVDTIKQLQGHAVVEDLASDFQVGHGSRLFIPRPAVHREFQGLCLLMRVCSRDPPSRHYSARRPYSAIGSRLRLL